MGHKLLMMAVLAATALGALATASLAQFNVGFATFDGGGGKSSAGSFSVSGTIGQPDAGTISGGSFFLSGGFWTGVGTVSGIDDGVTNDPAIPGGTTPLAFALHRSSPNPFGSSTQIVFDLPRSEAVRLRVSNLQGALVKTLLSETRDAGQHRVLWDGTDDRDHRVANGVYFVTVEAGAHRARQKITLLR